jgi:nucleoside-diphosphate-sugar epimerase
MRILITGASGKFGPILARALVAAGHQLTVLVHSKSPGIAGAAEVRGDMTRPEDLARACEGMEAVCHLATVKGDRSRFLEVNLRGLFNLLEHLRAAPERPQLVHLSGDNVLPIWDHPTPGPLAEDYPHLFVDDTYGLSKILEEVMALQYVRKFGLPVTVLRSSWVMEGGRIFTLCDPSKYGMKKYLPPELLGKIERREPFRIVPLDGRGRPLRRNVTDPRDLCRAFLTALGNPAARGELFNIAGPVFSHRDLAEHLSRADGLPVHDVPVPDAHSFEMDTGKAERVLGFRAEHTVFDTADRAAAGQ